MLAFCIKKVFQVTVFRKTVTCFLFAASKSQHRHISTANIRQKIEKCWLFHGSCEKKPTSSGTLGESDTPALAGIPANQPKLAYRQNNPIWHDGHIEHATPARYSPGSTASYSPSPKLSFTRFKVCWAMASARQAPSFSMSMSS